MAADSTFDRILRLAAERGASDVHLAADRPPTARVLGRLEPLPIPALDASTLESMAAVMAPERGHLAQTTGSGIDLAIDLDGVGRIRLHVFRRQHSVAIAARLVPATLPAGTAIAPSSWVARTALLRQGLVLVCGPTGSGKSTTLATLIDRINHERDVHIVTIEDPIEYIHRPQRAFVTQRELHTDTSTFAEALRQVLRQDPDVVLIGEIRDRETLEAALTVAETGHLVLSSLHTGSAAQAVQRVIDLFPPSDQGPIRAQLSSVLELVVAQRLVPRADGRGRIAVQELLQVTPAIRNLIREGKTHQIENTMQLGPSASGSRSFHLALLELYQSGAIDRDVALAQAPDPDAMLAALAGRPLGAARARGA